MVCKHHKHHAETFRWQLSLLAMAGRPPQGHTYLPLHGKALLSYHNSTLDLRDSYNGDYGM
jgi:hypothetical protein